MFENINEITKSNKINRSGIKSYSTDLPSKTNYLYSDLDINSDEETT